MNYLELEVARHCGAEEKIKWQSGKVAKWQSGEWPQDLTASLKDRIYLNSGKKLRVSFSIVFVFGAKELVGTKNERCIG
ncbi:hypothetical protein VNO77_25167 [Canavalia gladiata]|uniref:Uncharacterized protein n=1 Tax=Canavalia gladiata TaxID=3824 RepID=A0AAN9L7N2_CANGL